MITLITSVGLFVGIVIGWAWHAERRSERQRQALRAWYHEHVPIDEIPRHLRR